MIPELRQWVSAAVGDGLPHTRGYPGPDGREWPIALRDKVQNFRGQDLTAMIVAVGASGPLAVGGCVYHARLTIRSNFALILTNRDCQNEPRAVS